MLKYKMLPLLGLDMDDAVDRLTSLSMPERTLSSKSILRRTFV